MKKNESKQETSPEAEDIESVVEDSKTENSDEHIEIVIDAPDNYPPGFVKCNRHDKIVIALCVIPTLVCTAAGMGISIALLMLDSENKKTTDNQNDSSDLINSFVVPLAGTVAGGVVGLASAGIYRFGSYACSFFRRGNQVAQHTEPQDRNDYQPMRQAV